MARRRTRRHRRALPESRDEVGQRRWYTISRTEQGATIILSHQSACIKHENTKFVDGFGLAAAWWRVATPCNIGSDLSYRSCPSSWGLRPTQWRNQVLDAKASSGLRGDDYEDKSRTPSLRLYGQRTVQSRHGTSWPWSSRHRRHSKIDGDRVNRRKKKWPGCR